MHVQNSAEIRFHFVLFVRINRDPPVQRSPLNLNFIFFELIFSRRYLNYAGKIALWVRIKRDPPVCKTFLEFCGVGNTGGPRFFRIRLNRIPTYSKSLANSSIPAKLICLLNLKFSQIERILLGTGFF